MRRRFERRKLDGRLPAGEFVALDTEATGLDPRRDSPVSVAAIPFAGGVPRPGAGFASLVNPGRPIPIGAQKVHGITDADVIAAPPAEDVLPHILERCRTTVVLVGYHISFDIALLNRVARRAGAPRLRLPALDVACLAGCLSGHWAELPLEELASRLDVPVEGRHSAVGDAVMSGRLYVRLVPLLQTHGVATLGEALRFQGARPAGGTSRPGSP